MTEAESVEASIHFDKVFSSLPLKCKEVMEISLKAKTDDQITIILNITIDSVKEYEKQGYRTFQDNSYILKKA